MTCLRRSRVILLAVGLALLCGGCVSNANDDDGSLRRMQQNQRMAVMRAA